MVVPNDVSVAGDVSAAEQLRRDGFCLLPGVLGQSLRDELADLAERKIAEQAAADASHFDRFSHHGSLIPIRYHDVPLVSLLTAPEVRDAFRSLGFADPRWISGYVISKPPRSPGLWWHQDWWAWGHPRSYLPQVTQIFCMTYLQPTSPENGCLRAVPGSHLRRHRLHDALPEPHTPTIEAQAEDSISHVEVPDEIDVLTNPGDLVIGDVRVLHATHPNTTDHPRTAIDVLLVPDFGALPNEFRAHYVNQFCLPPVGWWEQPDSELHDSPLRNLLPTYDGPDRERMMSYRRSPCWPTDR